MKKLLYLPAIFILVSFAFAYVAHASTIRVGLTRSFENQNSISVGNTSIEVGAGFGRTLNSPNGFTVRQVGGQVVIQAGGSTVFTFANTEAAQIRAAGGGVVRLGSESYRGIIEFRRSAAQVTAINVINMEQYLYGVVAMEMSPNFHQEALRAQVVAARTFAAYTRNSSGHRGRGFDVCDTTCCQAYRGTYREHTNITQAVRDTAGIMMFAPGSSTPLFTPYFSSSGGSTDNVENVWVATLPHLRGVWDPYETTPRLWTRTLTWAQLTNAVRGAGGNIGDVTGVAITELNLARPQEVTFFGANGSWSVSGERIMNIFPGGRLLGRVFTIYGASGSSGVSFSDAASTAAGLPVTVTCGIFTVSEVIATNLYVVDEEGNTVPVANPTVYDGTTTRQLYEERDTETISVGVMVTGGEGITIEGRGWGHGVGMSQNGANGMAHAGYTWREILHHYYTGVEIR